MICCDLKIFETYEIVPENDFTVVTLPETNSSPLKMDGWKTSLSFWDGLSGAMLLVGGFNPSEKYYIVKLDHFSR